MLISLDFSVHFSWIGFPRENPNIMLTGKAIWKTGRQWHTAIKTQILSHAGLCANSRSGPFSLLTLNKQNLRMSVSLSIKWVHSELWCLKTRQVLSQVWSLSIWGSCVLGQHPRGAKGSLGSFFQLHWPLPLLSSEGRYLVLFAFYKREMFLKRFFI